jgi:DNA-binding NtrC family response regulator
VIFTTTGRSMSTDHESLEKARESFLVSKRRPITPEPREKNKAALAGDLFSGRILEQVTDVLMLLLRKDSPHGLSLKDVLESLERNVLVTTLSDCNGHQVSAAKFLHLKPTTLCAKLKRYRVKTEFKGTARISGVGPREYETARFELTVPPRRGAADDGDDS